MRAEDGRDGGYFGVKVAHPNQAVAFDAVPEIVLHVQVDGVGAGVPDLVQTRVAAPERSQVGQVAVDEAGIYLPQDEFRVGVQQVDAHEAESRVADFGNPQPRQLHREVAHGMVVACIGLSARFAHGFRYGFTQANAYVYRFLRSRHPGYQADSPVDFAPEVQQDGRLLPLGAFHPAQMAGGHFGLAIAGFQQIVLAADVSLHPNDTHRRQVVPHAFVALLSRDAQRCQGQEGK